MRLPTPPPEQPPQPQPQPQPKLIVEVVEARDLLPKDGQGSSSPYVVVDFDGQRKRTSTKQQDLNPVWNEQLEFIISDPNTMDTEELDVEVYNDKRMTPAAGAKKNHFLGRVKLYGSQLSKKGEEGLIYFSLEKKNVFSWIRGEIGLRIYYYDETVEGDSQPPPAAEPEPPPDKETRIFEVPVPTEIALETAMGPRHPPMVVVEEAPPMVTVHPHHADHPLPYDHYLATQQHQREAREAHAPPHAAEMRRMQSMRSVETERGRVMRRMSSDYAPRTIFGKFPGGESERITAFDLVEPMSYLFVRILKARGLGPNESPFVKIRTANHQARSRPGVQRPGEPPGHPEWHQVFALRQGTSDVTLEISVWDSAGDKFLGGVCFDLSDVPLRDPPDSPLAPQWYRLEGSGDDLNRRAVSGDIQLAVWIGTQADEAFPEAWCSDAPSVSYTRSKVYQSPKLWYLRVVVIEAQDLQIVPNLPPMTAPDIRVKAQLPFQMARTRRGSMNNSCASVHWNEDLVLVVSEPLEEQLILVVEDSITKERVVLGHAMVPLASIEQRFDERHVASKWVPLEGGGGDGGPGSQYRGRIHLRMYLEGGYHVLDEAAHVSSDFRPTAKQLWKPAMGVLELGLLGGRGLLPMKTKGVGKGSTDAYCVAKYGKKWVRTRTITDSLDPRWNEQYTWQVYDPCTVLTIGVFDNWRMFADVGKEKPDYKIGKVRIRVSTLESNRVYTNSYPLMMLLPTGLKKMGEIELAVRFVCPSLFPEMCTVYGQPLLPRMHYLKPLGVAHQEALRGTAIKMVAAWLARSEPPLGPEVVKYMLDADSHVWSMRKTKSNWFRIVAMLAWAVGLAKWVDDIKRWKNPVTTMLVHVLYLVLVWFPDLIVPTGFLYIFLIGIWYYRFRPKIPAGTDIWLSQTDTIDTDELDEEFDSIPSSRPPEFIRARYDRLRILAGRVQTVLGDFATQGERVQALVSWRDPRATKLFIGVCLMATVVLYVVPAKMVAVALGFYFLRHPMFRDPMPPKSVNFFRRLPSLSDRLL
ncbi:hypothetical protein Drorol1_Dr00012280 [Drosera rotundifolia]